MDEIGNPLASRKATAYPMVAGTCDTRFPQQPHILDKKIPFTYDSLRRTHDI